jgi:hypothetical protein
MKKFYLVLIFLITSCSSFKEKAGLVKYQPDEYQVVTNPPLVVPPDFNVQSPEELISKKNSEHQTAHNVDLSAGEEYILQNLKK